MAQELRIFISSPSDVTPERRRAALVVENLAKEYSRFFDIKPVLWETEPMLASGHFQDVIIPPSETDVVVLILWSRLGTPLPERTLRNEYRGIDGRVPVTGTEWEFESALEANRRKGLPDLLAYKKKAAPRAEYRTAADAEALGQQLQKLETFWSRYFADRGEFRAAYSEFDDLDSFEPRLTADLRRLIERRIPALRADVRSGLVPTWVKGSPFRGLETYRFEHSAIFFGRSEATRTVVEHLVENAESGRAFLLILGASGAGKSSVAQAGVLPALAVRGVVPGVGAWRRAVMRPAGDPRGPFASLAAALSSQEALPELLGGQDIQALARHLQAAAAEPSFTIVSALTARERAARDRGELLSHETVKLVLVVDQLEELFTVTDLVPTERNAFITCVEGLSRSGRVFVVATMRNDYWHRAAELPALVALAEGRGRFDLLGVTQAEITEMVRRSAEAGGLAFETDPRTEIRLDSVLAQEAASEPGALPLLSFLLDALYSKEARSGSASILSYASVRELGGLKGAIANRAEAAFARLPDEARNALPAMLRALVTVSRSGAEPTARAAPLSRFPEGSPERGLIEGLLDPGMRLLVAEGDGAGASVRLAHEALIGHWDRAKRQIAQDRDDLRTRTVVEETAAEWRLAQSREKRGYLLREPQLALALDLKSRWPDAFDHETLGFIQSSHRHAQLRQRLTVAAAAVFALVALTASALGIFAYRSEQRAQQQRNQALIAQAHFLSDAARAQTTEGDATTGMLLALEAISDPDSATSRPYVPEAAKRLLASSEVSRELLTIPFDLGSIFSSDGTRILGERTGYHWQLFDSRTGQLVCDITSSERSISPIFSGDGKILGYAPTQDQIILLNAQSCEPVADLTWPQSAHGVDLHALNRDGSIAVAGLGNGDLQKWNTRERVLMAEFRHPSGSFGQMALSPDGEHIATGHRGGDPGYGNYSGKVILLGHDGSLTKVLEGRYGGVHLLRFSPDGGRLISATTGSAVCCDLWSEVPLWDAASGELIRVLDGHTRSMKALAFSPDGKRLLTASADGTTQLWDAENGRAIGDPMRADNSLMVAVAFSPDGSKMLAAASDGTIWIRDLSGERPEAVIRGASGAALEHAGFLGDSDLVVTLGDDGTLRVFDARLGRVDVKEEEESLTIRTVLQGDRKPFSDPRNEAAFAAKRLPAALADSTLREELVSKVRSVIPRCLTAEQREAFYLPPAIPTWCGTLGKWPASAATLLTAGTAHLRRGKPAEADADFRKATALAPELEPGIRQIKASVAFDKGHELLLSGKTGDAEQSFALSVSLDPTLATRRDEVRVLSDLASARDLLRRGWHAAAIERFEAFIKKQPEARTRLAPEIASAHSEWGDELLRAGRLEDALSRFNKAIENDAGQASFYSNRGRAYLASGDYGLALADFGKALEIDAKEFAAHQNAGATYYRQRDLDGALVSYTKAAELAPADSGALFWSGFVSFLKGDYSEGSVRLRRSVERYDDEYAMLFSFIAGARSGRPTDVQLEGYLVSFRGERWPGPVMKLFVGKLKADELLMAAGDSPERRCEAHFYIGEWHSLRGNRAEAERELKLAAEQCPPDFLESAAARSELSRFGSTR